MDTNNPIFELNEQLDINVCLQFIDIKTGGIDFGEGIISLYPQLKSAKEVGGEKRRKFIEKFVKDYYQNSFNDLQEALNKTRFKWQKSQEEFFNLTKKVFLAHPWPKGKYICFLSIFNCNPRFLENKTFQVYYKHPQGTNHVIAHELLHFIFYDYLEKEEKQFMDSKGEDKIWVLSEAFNDVVLGRPEFKNFKPKTQKSYPRVENITHELAIKLKSKPLSIKNFLSLVRYYQF